MDPTQGRCIQAASRHSVMSRDTDTKFSERASSFFLGKRGLLSLNEAANDLIRNGLPGQSICIRVVIHFIQRL